MILFFLFFLILFLNLKHCISFAKHQNESATGILTLPIFLRVFKGSIALPTLCFQTSIMECENKFLLFKAKKKGLFSCDNFLSYDYILRNI